MKRNNILPLLIVFILITISKECEDNEILKNYGSCVPIEALLNDPNHELDLSNINYLTGEIKTISQNGYDIDFLRLNSRYLQSKDISQSKIYIPKKCLDAMEEKLNVDKINGIVMIVSNWNNKNSNGLPERYFVIRFSGYEENKFLHSSIYDFSICNQFPILLNTSINIDEIKAFKKKEKQNAKEPDIYEKIDINIKRVLYAKKVNVDLFDPHSDFLENICFKFKSERDTDVTLETRLLDYYQNVTLCNSKLNAHYMDFNYTGKILTYCCAYGYFRDENDKKSYIDNLDSKMNIVFSNSNFKVITCYKEILQFKLIYKNYGELICMFVFFMQLIFFMSFCCQGIAPLKKQIDNLISNASKVSPIIEFQQQEQENNGKSERIRLDQNSNDITNIQINKNIPSNVIPVYNNISNNNNNNSFNISFDVKSNHEIITNKNLELPKSNNFNNNANVQNPPHKGKKRQSVNLMNNNNELILNDNGENKGVEGEIKKNKKRNRRKSLNIQKSNNCDNIVIENIDKNDVAEEQDIKTHLPEENKENKKLAKIKQEKEKEIKEEKEEQIKRQKIIRRRSSQIFAFDNDDLNELNFDEAKVFDKRHFCKYYCFMIQISNIIVNTFCRCSDYNLFSVKLGLLLFLFPINLTFNAFFFTSKEIQSVYINKLSDITIDYKNLIRSLSSSVISSIILVFLKLICLTHHSIRKLKKCENLEEAKIQAVKKLKCVKIRISLYYIFSLIFLIIFGFYISCFCAIFENTQLVLIESMATSWFLSLFYPFAICFITSIFRRGSLVCGKRGIGCCYRINKILQMI